MTKSELERRSNNFDLGTLSVKVEDEGKNLIDFKALERF